MSRIFVIEDDAGLREGIADLLQLHGHRVEVFDSAAVALERLNDGARPHLIVLDLSLRPDMTGWQFMRLLRADARWQRTRVLVATGLPLTRELRDECLADALIGKPFDIDALLEVVEQLLAPARTVA